MEPQPFEFTRDYSVVSRVTLYANSINVAPHMDICVGDDTVTTTADSAEKAILRKHFKLIDSYDGGAGVTVKEYKHK